MRDKILEVLSKEDKLDYMELFDKAAPRVMLGNRYYHSIMYPKLLREMVDEGLIMEDGFVERFVMPKKKLCVLYTITEKGRKLIN